jgi:hypothetical protein
MDSRIWSAVLVQMNGWGLAFQFVIQARMSASSAARVSSVVSTMTCRPAAAARPACLCAAIRRVLSQSQQVTVANSGEHGVEPGHGCLIGPEQPPEFSCNAGLAGARRAVQDNDGHDIQHAATSLA